MTRALICGSLTVVCLVAICAVISQRHELAGLRAEQQRIVASLADSDKSPQPPVGSETDDVLPAPAAGSPELLHLRSDVNRLTQQLRTLSGVSNEHIRLVAQVADRSNNTNGLALPPGYIRTSHAQLVGYNSPEDTIQSFLWAVHNRDLNAMLSSLTPNMAQRMGIHAQQPVAEDFFKGMQDLPGMGIVGRQTLPDGSVELELQMVPGASSGTGKFVFQLVDGQWRIAQEH